MKNFIARGEVLTLPNSTGADIASGAGVVIGSIFGIAANDAAAGDEVVLNVVGLFELPKTASQAWDVGDLIFWDSAAREATTADTGFLIGAAVEAVGGGAAATLGKVRLSGSTASGGGGAAVESVNGQTGAVTLTAADVEALPDSYTPPAPAWGAVTGKPATFAPTIGTTAATAAAGNHTHTFAAMSGSVADATGATLQAILNDLAARVTALEGA